MAPSLKPHQEVLINLRAYNNVPPLPGDIVVAYHPAQANLLIVKRILFVEEDGRCYLHGDNTIKSSDSREFGLVSQKHIIGKVHCLLP